LGEKVANENNNVVSLNILKKQDKLPTAEECFPFSQTQHAAGREFDIYHAKKQQCTLQIPQKWNSK
jgi:hypothetical protein